MDYRNYELMLSPEVRCKTPCPVVPGRMIASGNCKTLCGRYCGKKIFSSNIEKETGVVLCLEREKEDNGLFHE